MTGYTIEHQPDAAAGYEWFWEVPWPTNGPPTSSCGTASTREDAVAGAEAELADLRRSTFRVLP